MSGACGDIISCIKIQRSRYFAYQILKSRCLASIHEPYTKLENNFINFNAF